MKGHWASQISCLAHAWACFCLPSSTPALDFSPVLMFPIIPLHVEYLSPLSIPPQYRAYNALRKSAYLCFDDGCYRVRYRNKKLYIAGRWRGGQIFESAHVKYIQGTIMEIIANYAYRRYKMKCQYFMPPFPVAPEYGLDESYSDLILPVIIQHFH